MNGVKISTLRIDPAVIRVCVTASEPGTACVAIIREGCGEAAATAEVVISGKKCEGYADIEIPDAALWDTKNPNLYTAKVTFGDDAVCETFGIRTLEWNTKKGIAINGHHVIIRGACIHHDNGILGACTYPEAEERRIRILKENGYNAVRSAHNPASKYQLEACDRLGVLMMDEYVDCWFMHKTRNDYAGTLMKWWKQDLKDLVDKDFNHPCVIMYSTGNEVAESAKPAGIDLQAQFTQYLHSIDPTRPVTCGINIFFNFLSTIGLGVYSDDKAEKQAAEAAKAGEGKPKKKAVGSEFYNMLAVKMGTGFMKFGASTPPSDWTTRKVFAAMDIAGYNYGINRYVHDLKKYPDRLILGSETFVSDAYAFYELAKKNPRLVGDFDWAGWDYIGETGLGAAEYEDYLDTRPETQMTGGNGRIDLLGKPRCEALYKRVAFQQETGPYIGVYPAYTKKLVFNGWSLTKALASWSYRGYNGNETDIEVYARAASVELLINGRTIGRKDLKNTCMVTFRAPYESGTITAVSYDKDGREINRCSLETAGEETCLRVEPEVAQVGKEGLVYVPIRYTDIQGVWKPMEKHTISVSVENGELLGLGTAAPYFEGNYTNSTVATYFGEALAVVRANGEGDVKVTVTDEEREETACVALV